MIRTLVLLMLINIPSVASATWKENYFELNTSYSFSQTDLESVYPKSTYLHQVKVTADKQYLSDGYGVRLKTYFAPYYIKQEQLQENKATDYSVGIESILFLSENSETAGSYSSSSKLQHFDQRLNNILLGFSEELMGDVEQVNIDYTLGKDKSFFFLDINYDFITEDKVGLVTNEVVESEEHTRLSSNFLWRQSDDTLWGARVEALDSQRSINSSEQTVQVNNYYLQMVTNYLGNSQLTVNLGRSEADEQEQFSWDVTHISYFSDHTSFHLQSSRKLVQTIDNSIGEDLSTKHTIHFNYQPLDYVDSEFKYSIEQRKRADIKTYDEKSLAFNLSVKYQESWRVSASFKKQQLDDHANNQTISQNMISLTLSGNLA